MSASVYLCLLTASFILLSCAEEIDYASFPKIDAHVHIDTMQPNFPRFAKENHFQLITLVTGSESAERIEREKLFAQAQQQSFPDIAAYATSFSMEDWSADDWQAKTIRSLEEDFNRGAIAVKVWKDIGMTFRDEKGRFIMIDDPRFDPIFNFIAEKEKAVIGHLGEPRNCWLPLEQMTVRSDSSYFTEHPQYHMALHPDYPSYEEQIAARDHLLEKHPYLTFIGAHLGSLEWNVDELAKRLDQYPHFAVDMAARICHFQVQDREKVRNFIMAYADRLLYGTDISTSDDADNLGWIDTTWRKDWQYFATDDLMQADQVRQPFRGLDLPQSVLKKIYHDNAVAWLKIGE